MTEAESSLFWSAVIVMGVFCAIVGGAITQNKGRGFWEGFFVGGFLGVIGLIIVLVTKPQKPHVGGMAVPDRECPYCRQMMPANASVCHRCARESHAWTLHEGKWWTQDDSDKWYVLNPTTNAWELHG